MQSDYRVATLSHNLLSARIPYFRIGLCAGAGSFGLFGVLGLLGSFGLFGSLGLFGSFAILYSPFLGIDPQLSC
jgi:hypothetical protein